MSARSFILWAIAGFLGFAALSMQDVSEAPALTLERGLGPEVDVSSL